ncbi:hypothetical protein SDC9_164282 [bioreactor metagenome]|uniref:Uncharacterized protein n=1 Tax=bioreactor metagenome TaxID=1076179 RepID=A0A645FYE7_9ZZZZ
MGACSVDAVVDVYGLQPLQADDIIELVQDTAEVVHYIVTGIENVTGIQADPYAVLHGDPVDYAPQLLEGPADL